MNITNISANQSLEAQEELPVIAEYNGKPVYVWKASEKEIILLIHDAERIMGVRLSLKGDWLEPPEKGTLLWNYVTELLECPPPFVFANNLLVSLSQIKLYGNTRMF